MTLPDRPVLPPYRSRVFHHMPGWEKLEPLGEHIYLPGNHYIVTPGDPVKYCYLMLEGRAISLETTPEGVEHIFNVFEPGSIFLESNVLAGYEADVFFQTVTACELVRIEGGALKRAMCQDEDIFQLVMDSFASKYYSAMDQLRETYNREAVWKVYNMMVLLADGIGKPCFGDWVMIDMKITQQTISSMLGLNRITVSRALKELKDAGKLLIVNNGYYCVQRESPRGREQGT